MGFEKDDTEKAKEKDTKGGVEVEDVKLALSGHVTEGYKVQSLQLW